MGILKIILIIVGIALVTYAAAQWTASQRRIASITIIVGLAALLGGVGWILYPSLAANSHTASQPTAGNESGDAVENSQRNITRVDDTSNTTTDRGDTGSSHSQLTETKTSNPVVYYSSESEIKKPSLLISDKSQRQLAVADEVKSDDGDDNDRSQSTVDTGGGSVTDSPTKPTEPVAPVNPDSPDNPGDNNGQPATPNVAERVDMATEAISAAVLASIGASDGIIDQHQPAIWGVDDAAKVEALGVGGATGDAQSSITSLIHQMVEHDLASADYSSDESYRTRAAENAIKILRGLIIIDRTYGVPGVGVEALNSVRFNPSGFGEEVSSLDWLIKAGSLSYDDYLPINIPAMHAKLFTAEPNQSYDNFIAKLIADSGGSI